MRRLPIFLAIFLAGAASAAADLIDVRELGNGHQPDVFILFDAGPEIEEARIVGRAIEMDITAALTGSRRIEPARSRWISSIETLTVDGQQILRLELVEAAEAVQVIRTQSGLRLTWTPVPAEADGPRMVEAVPARVAELVTEPPHDDVASAAARSAESAEDQVLALAASEAGVADHQDAVGQQTAGSDACAAAEAALEVDSWNIDALTVSAGCRLENGETQQAITMLERVIAFEPGRFDAVIALAEANESLGNIENARVLYEQAAMVAATDGQAVAARARARRLTN